MLSQCAVLSLQQLTGGLRGGKRGKGSRSATGAEPVGSGGGDVDLPGVFGSRSPTLEGMGDAALWEEGMLFRAHPIGRPEGAGPPGRGAHSNTYPRRVRRVTGWPNVARLPGRSQAFRPHAG
jgi:hypothetical protein